MGLWEAVERIPEPCRRADFGERGGRGLLRREEMS